VITTAEDEEVSTPPPTELELAELELDVASEDEEAPLSTELLLAAISLELLELTVASLELLELAVASPELELEPPMPPPPELLLLTPLDEDGSSSPPPPPPLLPPPDEQENVSVMASMRAAESVDLRGNCFICRFLQNKCLLQ